MIAANAPHAKVGGKGLFIKELEHALLDGRADIAVHSMKDVPVELPPELHLPVIMVRADPRDALVSTRFGGLDALPVRPHRGGIPPRGGGRAPQDPLPRHRLADAPDLMRSSH